MIEYFPEEQITIKDFFRKKSLPEGIASKIFGGILDDSLIPLGRIGNEISDIIFTKQQLSNYLTDV